MNNNEYSNPDQWTGGYYEIYIEYRPTGIDNNIQDALDSQYKCSFFKGMWEEKNYIGKEHVTLPIHLVNESVHQY